VHEYVVSARNGTSDVPRYDVRIDGARIARTNGSRDLESVLVHDVTTRALAETDDLVLHAGGVVHGGAAIALPGTSAVGKSTLVAGLVRAGMGYLTDEALAIDRTSLVAEPYAKPLSMDGGAWALFPELGAVGVLPEDDRHPVAEWQVAPDDLRPDCLAPAASITHVLFPRYADGSDAVLEPISRGAALIEATQHTFEFRDRARANLDALAEVLGAAECFTFTIGDLETAVGRVIDLVGVRDARIER
jgi:hypothetical protein